MKKVWPEQSAKARDDFNATNLPSNAEFFIKTYDCNKIHMIKRNDECAGIHFRNKNLNTIAYTRYSKKNAEISTSPARIHSATIILHHVSVIFIVNN